MFPSCEVLFGYLCFLPFKLLVCSVFQKFRPLRTLDLDGNGYLDFKENMLAMDLVNAKTPVDKLKWAFRM